MDQMMVSSVLELYTTGYGWALYNLIFGLFAATGILAYPFLILMYDSWRTSSENASTVSMSSFASVQLIKWRLLFALVVFLLAVIPSQAISFNQIFYDRSCNVDGTPNTGAPTTQGNDASTFQHLQSPTSVGETKVPILWSLVLAVSGGFNRFVVNDLPCFPDITEIDSSLRSVVIDDANTQAEYDQFLSQCYRPAVSRYAEATGPFLDQINTIRAGLDIEESELTELDSELFKAVPGLYGQCGGQCANGLDSLQSADPVRGFPFNAERDASYSELQGNEDGSPYCGEWWTSLREKVADNAVTQTSIDEDVNRTARSVYLIIRNNIPFIDATDEDITKLTIRAAARNTPFSFTEIYAANRSDGVVGAAVRNIDGDLLNVAGGAAALGTGGLAAIAGLVPGVDDAVGGIASTIASWVIFMTVLVKGAPMMQAMILMLIYAFLPIYLVISKYEVESVITAIALIFVVRIFTAVFEIAHYIEDSLFASMYPDLSLTGSVLTMGPDRLILAMVTAMLVVVAPLLLLQLVTLAGARINGVGGSGDAGLGRAANVGGNAGNALGRSGSSIATGTARNAVSRARST